MPRLVSNALLLRVALDRLPMTFPLTTFLIALAKVDRAKLARADATKLARKYGIDPAHAAGYIRMELGRW